MPTSYTRVFREVLPYYLSIGMTAAEFWHGDVTLAKAYRDAENMRMERRNAEFWLQGMYVYEAICDASPIFNPFAKRSTRPRPYPSQPYPMTTQKKRDEEQEARKQMEKAQQRMDAFASKFNSRFRKKQEVTKDG